MSLEKNLIELNQEFAAEDLQSNLLDIEPNEPEEKSKVVSTTLKPVDKTNTKSIPINQGPPKGLLDGMITPEKKQKALEASKKYRSVDSTATRVMGTARDLQRYQSYSDETFGSIGYYNLADINAKYNATASIGEEFGRQWTGMWELASVGFSDTYGFGLFKSDDNASEFMDIMNIYSSTRGGWQSTLGNGFLSSGYTVGIVTAIGAEELTLSAITAMTGGIGSAGQAVRTGSLIADAGQNISKFQSAVKSAGQAYEKTGDFINFWKAARNIGSARVTASSGRFTSEWLMGRSLQAIGSVGKGFRGIMPLAGTANFARNYSKISGANSITKTMLGAGALARDARTFYLSHSESKLEGDINKSENLEHSISTWYVNNPGKVMPVEVYNNYQQAALDTYNKVYASNFSTIYLSNALGLHALTKPLGKLQLRAAKAVSETGQFLVQRTGKQIAFEAMGSGVKNWFKTRTLGGTLRKTGEFIVGSSVEGLQEVVQDIIQEAGKDYYDNALSDLTAKTMSRFDPNFQGYVARGNFFKSLWDNRDKGTMESFISGFLIGFVAGPTNIVTQAVQDYTFGGKNYVWSKTGRDKHKKDYENRKETAEYLTAFYNASSNFIPELLSENLTAMVNGHENLLKAAREGNNMEAVDNKSDMFRYVVEQSLKHGLENELIEHFSQASSMTVEELNQFTARKDITEENKLDVIKDTDAIVSRIKEFKKNFDERNSNPNLINPYNIQDLVPNAPGNLETIIKHQAWEMMRNDYIFNKDAINDFKSRVINLTEKIKVDSNITDSEVLILTSPALLSKELNVLNEAIETNKEYATKENKFLETDEHLALVAKYNSLKKIQEAFKKLSEAEKSEKKSTELVEEAYADMFEGFNEYMNTVDNKPDSVGNRAINKKKFEYLWDIPILNKRSQRNLEHATSLLDPEYRAKHHESLVKMLLFLDSNKKQFIEQSLQSLSEKEAAKNIVTKLTEKKLIFSLKEIDDLIKKGIMPSQIFNIDTNEDATAEEYKIALDIINKEFENLTGKKITASRGLQAISEKFKDDKRTAADLLEQYKDITTIGELIKSMMGSSNISQADKAVLEILQDVAELQDIKIEISDNLDAPIESKKVDGQVTIAFDVRFSGFDYTGGKTRFEALLLSGILNGQLNSLLQSNEEFKNAVISVMEQVREGYEEMLNSSSATRKKLTEKGWIDAKDFVESIPHMMDPLLFLSQALHSEPMRDVLKRIEDVNSASTESLEDAINEEVRSALEKGFGSTEGNLLEKVISLASISFSSETLQDISEQDQARLVDLGISQEEWNNLTKEEKDDILNCR